MAIVLIFGRDKYEAPSEVMTGAELRRLFNVPGSDNLYRAEGSKVEGNPIGDAEQVPLKNGEHFIAIPKDVSGGAVELTALPARVAAEVAEISAEFDENGPTRVLELGGERGIVFSVTAPGWQPSPLPVLIKVPPLYPDQRPDLIFIPSGVTAPWGAPSRVMGSVQLGGQAWFQISWHMGGAYESERHNLVAFAKSVGLYVSRQV